MMSDLESFLKEWRGVPYVVGESDCIMFVCAWYRMLTGVDPAAKLRGAFDTPLAAQCLTAARGPDGLSAFASLMHRADRVTDEPVGGDIGVIRFRGPFQPSQIAPERASIYTGAMWALKSARGIGFLKPTMTRTIGLWRVS